MSPPSDALPVGHARDIGSPQDLLTLLAAVLGPVTEADREASLAASAPLREGDWLVMVPSTTARGSLVPLRVRAVFDARDAARA